MKCKHVRNKLKRLIKPQKVIFSVSSVLIMQGTSSSNVNSVTGRFKRASSLLLPLLMVQNLLKKKVGCLVWAHNLENNRKVFKIGNIGAKHTRDVVHTQGLTRIFLWVNLLTIIVIQLARSSTYEVQLRFIELQYRKRFCFDNIWTSNVNVSILRNRYRKSNFEAHKSNFKSFITHVNVFLFYLFQCENVQNVSSNVKAANASTQVSCATASPIVWTKATRTKKNAKIKVSENHEANITSNQFWWIGLERKIA